MGVHSKEVCAQNMHMQTRLDASSLVSPSSRQRKESFGATQYKQKKKVKENLQDRDDALPSRTGLVPAVIGPFS